MSASQDFRDGTASGALELARRLMQMELWGVAITSGLAQALADGIRYEYGGTDAKQEQKEGASE